MLTLCQNREEGFGPSSKLSSVPTTCFVDTIIVPLPVWIYLLLLPILFLLTSRLQSSIFNPSLHRPRRSCIRLTVTILYYALLAAQILMLTLEIVRLALINRSPDLLPFQYVAIILGTFLHFSNGAWGRFNGAYWKGANVFVWVGLVAVTCVKISGLGMMMDMPGENKGLERKGSKYPLSDQIIDVAVMAGVYFVVAVLELVLGLWKGAKRSGRAESAATEEEGIVEPGTSMGQVGWAK